MGLALVRFQKYWLLRHKYIRFLVGCQKSKATIFMKLKTPSWITTYFQWNEYLLKLFLQTTAVMFSKKYVVLVFPLELSVVCMRMQIVTNASKSSHCKLFYLFNSQKYLMLIHSPYFSGKVHFMFNVPYFCPAK